jgi:MFS family permease
VRIALVTRPFLLACLSTFACFAAIGVQLPTLPRYVERSLGAGDTAIGALVAVFGLAGIASRPLLPRLERRGGISLLMIGGAAIQAVAIAVTGWLSLLPLFALRAASGVGEAMQFVGVASYVNGSAPAERRAEANSYLSVALFAGLGIGPVIGEPLADAGRFNAAFVLAGGLAVVGALLAVAIPRPPRTAAPTVDAATKRTATSRWAWLHPLGFRVGLVLGFGLFGWVGWSTFLALRADEVDVPAGVLYGGYSAIVLVLRLAGAKIPDRVGHRRCVRAALVLMATGLTVAGVVDGATGLIAGSVVLAIGISLIYPSLAAIVSNSVADDERTAALSTFTMFFEVANVVGGLSLGLVAEIGTYQSAFVAGAAVTAVGLLVAARALVATGPVRSPSGSGGAPTP